VSSEPVDIWENEVYLAGRYRERMAWRITFGAMTLAIIALVSLAANFSLQHTEYVVVKVDARTGDADITSIVETTNVSTDEVLAEAFVHKYVIARETYDSWDQKRRINEVWTLFSEGRAKEELFALYTNENPLNPIRRYGAGTKISVNIKSISLDDPTSARVRIEKVFANGSSKRSQNFIVTMRFFSDLAREATREFRRKNPVAFFVDEYRIDAEAS